LLINPLLDIKRLRREKTELVLRAKDSQPLPRKLCIIQKKKGVFGGLNWRRLPSPYVIQRWKKVEKGGKVEETPAKRGRYLPL